MRLFHAAARGQALFAWRAGSLDGDGQIFCNMQKIICKSRLKMVLLDSQHIPGPNCRQATGPRQHEEDA